MTYNPEIGTEASVGESDSHFFNIMKLYKMYNHAWPNIHSESFVSIKYSTSNKHFGIKKAIKLINYSKNNFILKFTANPLSQSPWGFIESF